MLFIEIEDGPQLGRPQVDQIKDSSYKNMKELRVQVASHPFRAFIAFDPARKAIVLCAGDKKGKDEKLFYKRMIKIADAEFKSHLKSLEVKTMTTLKKMMAKRSPESRARIETRTAEIRQEITLARLREELSTHEKLIAKELP